MGTILPTPKFQAFDDTGAPLNGGKLYTYKPGTSTDKAAYTDRACTTPATNPIILDANGQASVFLLGSYKLKLDNSSDVEQWTMDNIEGMGESETAGANYPDYTEADHQVNSGATVAALLSAIGTTTKATIIFRHNEGLAQTKYHFTTTYDASAYKNVTFQFDTGAVLDVATGVTVTLPSPDNVESADNQQLFVLTGSGVVKFNTAGTVYPDWWTENSTPGTTDMQTAMTNAEASFVAGGMIKLLGQTYHIADDVTINSDVGFDALDYGAIVDVATAKTLILNGLVHAGRKQTFSGSGVAELSATSVHNTVFPEWWGDTGNSASYTDEVEINAAITMAASASFAVISLDGKQYYIGAGIDMGTSGWLLLKGDGTKNTLINRTATGFTSILIQNDQHAVQDLYLNHTGTPISGDFGIKIEDADFVKVKDVFIAGHFIGLRGQGTSQTVLQRIKVMFTNTLGAATAGTYGFHFNEGTGSTSNSIFMAHCEVFQSTTANKYHQFGIYVNSADGIWLDSCHFWSAYSAGAYIKPENNASRCAGVKFDNCWFDSIGTATTGYGVWFDGSVTTGAFANNGITNCHFTGTGTIMTVGVVFTAGYRL